MSFVRKEEMKEGTKEGTKEWTNEQFLSKIVIRLSYCAQAEKLYLNTTSKEDHTGSQRGSLSQGVIRVDTYI